MGHELTVSLVTAGEHSRPAGMPEINGKQLILIRFAFLSRVECWSEYRQRHGECSAKT